MSKLTSEKKINDQQSPNMKNNPTSNSKLKGNERLVESSPTPRSFEGDNDRSNIQVVKKFVEIAKRWARYKLTAGFTGLRINYLGTSILGYKTIKLLDTTKKIIFRWKVSGWSKLISNRLKANKKEEGVRRLIFLISGLNVRRKRNAFIKMRGNSIISLAEEKSIKSFDNTTNKSGKGLDPTASNKSLKANMDVSIPITDGILLQKMILSQQALASLKKIIRYDKRVFFTVSTTEVKDSIEIEKKRLIQVKNTDRNLRIKQFDNEVLLNVMINFIRALVESHQQKQQFQRKSISLTEKISSGIVEEKTGSFNTGIARRYEMATKQIQSADEEIKLLIEQQKLDYDKLVKMLRDQVLKFKRNKNDKLISSRIRLCQIIINLVANFSSGETINQNSHHHYVQIINELVNKVKELSTVCQQIPQLETFKRTLDLSQVSHQEYFNKIVDVLIELHHRVNELLRLRPQDMLSYIDMVRSQCINIQNITNIFIENVQSDEVQELAPIVFNAKKGSYPQEFNVVHRNISMLSKLLIKERGYSFKSEEIIERVKIVIEIFWNVLSGLKSFERQWKLAKQNEEVSQIEKQVIVILDQCLDIFYNRIQMSQRKVQDMEDMFERKRNETSLYHEKLQLEINSLLSDFQNTSIKNQQLVTVLNKLMSQKEDLQKELKQSKGALNFHLSNTRADKKSHQLNFEQTQDILRQYQDQKTYIQQLENQLKKMAKDAQNMIKDKVLEYESKISSMSIELEYYQQQKILIKKKIQQINEKSIIAIHQIQQKNFQIESITARYQVIKKESQQQENKYRTIIRDLENKNLQLSQENKLLKSQNVMAEKNYKLMMEKFEGANKKMHQSIQVVQQQYIKEIQRISKQLQVERLHHSSQTKFQSITTVNSPNSQSNQSLRINFINKERQIYELQQQLTASYDSLQNRNDKINNLNGTISKLQGQVSTYILQISNLQETKNSNKSTQNLNELIRLRQENNLLKQQLKNSFMPKTVQHIESKNKLQFNNNTELNNAYMILKQQNQYLKIKINDFCSVTQNELIGLLDQLKRHQNIQYQHKENNIYNEKIIKTLNQEIQQLKLKLNKNQSVITLQSQIKSLNLKINQLQLIVRQKQEFKLKFLKQQAYILYLQEKVKSLENAINIISSQQQLLSQKYLQLLSRIGNKFRNTNQTVQVINSNEQITINKESIQQSQRIRSQEVYLKQINELKLFIENITKDMNLLKTKRNQQVQQKQTVIFQLNQKLSQSYKKIKYLDQNLNNTNKQFGVIEQSYNQRISNLKNQIEYLNSIISQSVQRPDDKNIKVINQTLQQLIMRVDKEDAIILAKLNQITRINKISNQLDNLLTPQIRKHVQILIEKNKTLIQSSITLIRQRQNILVVLRAYPNPEHLTQFLFRILLNFSLIPQGSLQCQQIIDNLYMIRQTTRGPEYFMVLEDYVRDFFNYKIIPKYLKTNHQTSHKVTIVRSQPIERIN